MNKYIPGDPFAYRGKHRKPRSRYAVKVAALAVPMTFAGLALVGVTPLAAHAAVKPAPSWEQRTCSAFAAWERHPTTARLARLAADSVHVPVRQLGGDVWNLVGDVEHARAGDKPSALYVSDDEQQTFTDCHNGYGL